MGQAPLASLLATIDPRDSDSGTAMLTWLQQTGRLQKIGNLDGVGYLFVYQEPKGSTREGWVAGGTQGDRIVDDALARAEGEGHKPSKRGLCDKCFSAVTQIEGESALAENASGDPATCPADGGQHNLVS